MGQNIYRNARLIASAFTGAGSSCVVDSSASVALAFKYGVVILTKQIQTTDKQ